MRFTIGKSAKVAFVLGSTVALAGVVFAGPATASTAPSQASTKTATQVFTDPANPPSIDDVSKNLSPDQKQLLASSTPKVILVSTKTSQVIKVTKASEAPAPQVQPRALSYCPAGYGCYAASRVPYADAGFPAFPGTEAGNWPSRKGYYPASRAVSACTIYGCYLVAQPGSSVLFDQPATGTSFTTY